ncbi:MAG: hypothetical protein ABIR57_01155 [Aeromicrobium sp.]
MDRKLLEASATRIMNLRGLFAIPLGLLFIQAGLGNLGWGVFVHNWVFVAGLVALGGVTLLIKLYYDANFGRVTQSPSRELRNTILSAIIFGLGLIGGSILDFKLDLPISLFSVCFAIAMLAWFALCIGLRPHHYVIWGALLVAGLMPIWGSLDDRASVAWLPIGAATIIAGIFDHLTLVRQYGLDREGDHD